MFPILSFFLAYSLCVSTATSNTSGHGQIMAKVKEHQRKCEAKFERKNSTLIPEKLDHHSIFSKKIPDKPVIQVPQQPSQVVLAVVSLPNFVIQIISKIVNGVDAQPGQFPYMVSLRYKPYAEHYCGGTLVTTRHILTAAHCVHDLLSPDEIYAVSGSISSITGGEVHDVLEIRIHEDYIGDSDYWQHDVAILKIAKHVNLDENRQTISLPTKEPSAGTNCTVNGWGYLHSWQQFPSTILQSLNQVIVDQTECRNLYSSMATIVDSHLCAFWAKGYGACGGDSGGPLVCDGEQQGIVSFSSGCDHGYPSVYTKLVIYKDWVKKNTEDVDTD